MPWSWAEVGTCRVDCTADAECIGMTCNENVGRCVPAETCTDTLDNDLDGEIDCADFECLGNAVCDPPCTSSQCSSAPPDPRTLAPQFGEAENPPFVDRISFLYSGANAIQTGVAQTGPHTLDEQRVADVVGRVLDHQGNPVAGVVVSAFGRNEWGATRSRRDGAFDFVVNGGGTVTLTFVHPDYLTVSRTVDAAEHEYAPIGDVVLTPATQTTFALVTSASAWSISPPFGAPGRDEEREVRLVVPPGFVAYHVQGTTKVPVTNALARVSVYTAGPRTREAMPEVLPPNTDYTFAAEFEGIVNGQPVPMAFSDATPLIIYVNNDPYLSSGSIVPVGHLDQHSRRWRSDRNGIVLGVVAVDTDGRAVFDSETEAMLAESVAVEGPHPGNTVTVAERASIADLIGSGTYAPDADGVTRIWRVPLTHFTAYDFNVAQAFAPPLRLAHPRGTALLAGECAATRVPGSVIECEEQVLTERIPLVGSPLSLHYRSDNSVSYAGRHYMSTGVSCTSPTRVYVSAAGVDNLPVVCDPASGVRYAVWDGRDRWGNYVNGVVAARIFTLTQNELVESSCMRWISSAFGRIPIACGAYRPLGRTADIPEVGRGSFQGRRSVGGGQFGDWMLSGVHYFDRATSTLMGADGMRAITTGESASSLSYPWALDPGCTAGPAGSTGPALEVELSAANEVMLRAVSDQTGQNVTCAGGANGTGSVHQNIGVYADVSACEWGTITSDFHTSTCTPASDGLIMGRFRAVESASADSTRTYFSRYLSTPNALTFAANPTSAAGRLSGYICAFDMKPGEDDSPMQLDLATKYCVTVTSGDLRAATMAVGTKYLVFPRLMDFAVDSAHNVVVALGADDSLARSRLYRIDASGASSAIATADPSCEISQLRADDIVGGWMALDDTFCLGRVVDIAFGASGEMFVLHTWTGGTGTWGQIVGIRNGLVRIVAGAPGLVGASERTLATDAGLADPLSIGIDQSGRLYYREGGVRPTIRRIDHAGFIDTVLGCREVDTVTGACRSLVVEDPGAGWVPPSIRAGSDPTMAVDRATTGPAPYWYPIHRGDFAIGRYSLYWINDDGNVRSLPLEPIQIDGEFRILSIDGATWLHFDSNGRQVASSSVTTGRLQAAYEYDPGSGRLSGIWVDGPSGETTAPIS
jgi:hypothetical protein